ncbi:MAG TPA: RNA polymerase sigma factor [Bryobacteraceae bacterium]|jgi:RNA polymerase sigma-70 factor (ECF subfamily)|nr:RNA polymerase sigma factor [Bryobacteraceae bacterium]
MKSSTEADAALADVRLFATPDSMDRGILEQEFDGLLAANGPALARLAATYTNTSSDRDDLLQEIAMAVWQALRTFRGECSPRTFLFRIAHNRAIAYLSRSQARFSSGAGDAAVDDLHDPAPDPESGLAREQAAARLRRAIHRLPMVYRQVIMLALEDMGYAEIAEVLGISESNVGARLTRARQLLRESLRESLEKRK